MDDTQNPPIRTSLGYPSIEQALAMTRTVLGGPVEDVPPVTADPVEPSVYVGPTKEEQQQAAAERAAESRRVAAAAQAAAEMRAKAKRLLAASRWVMGAVVMISMVITSFGAGNAHAVFARHDTADPWSWLPYPALEAALIVEIQAGGLLAEHKLTVKGWGKALRIVTALMAVTVCVYGPAETGDWGGAMLHAIGPVCQFFLAEFLAQARTQFRNAVDGLQSRADGREQAARDPLPADRSARSRTRSAKTTKTGSQRPRDGLSGTSGRDRSSDGPGGPEVVLTAHERRAVDKLIANGKTISKRNLIDEVRAGHGQIGTTRALAIARSYNQGTGGPELHVVTQKEA
jgi:hypothetical protein